MFKIFKFMFKILSIKFKIKNIKLFNNYKMQHY